MSEPWNALALLALKCWEFLDDLYGMPPFLSPAGPFEVSIGVWRGWCRRRRRGVSPHRLFFGHRRAAARSGGRYIDRRARDRKTAAGAGHTPTSGRSKLDKMRLD